MRYDIEYELNGINKQECYILKCELTTAISIIKQIGGKNIRVIKRSLSC